MGLSTKRFGVGINGEEYLLSVVCLGKSKGKHSVEVTVENPYVPTVIRDSVRKKIKAIVLDDLGLKSSEVSMTIDFARQHALKRRDEA